MVPVPSALGVLFHGCWVVVFAVLVPHFQTWRNCEGEGKHYIVLTAGLLAVFASSLLAEIGLTVIGCRGEEAQTVYSNYRPCNCF